MEIIDQDPISKEAANPLSHALISLRSIRDPFKEDITNIREAIDDIINNIDTSLYLAATKEEKQIRSITENINTVKRVLRSISFVISNNIPRKILQSQGVTPTSFQTPSTIPDVASLPNVSSLPNVPNQQDPTGLGRAPLKVGITTSEELVKAFGDLKSKIVTLEVSISALKLKIRETLGVIKERSDISIPLVREEKLSTVTNALLHTLTNVRKSLNRRIPTNISVELAPKELIEELISKNKINESTFNSASETYRRLCNIYDSNNERYEYIYSRFLGVRQYCVRLGFLAPEEGQESEEIDLPANMMAELTKDDPKEAQDDPKEAQDKPEDRSGDSPPLGIVKEEMNDSGAIIILADSYDRVLVEFMIKHAAEPSLFETLHTKVNELGQNLIAPFSSVTKRRVKIRKSLKNIKKAVINLLVEIRKTAGKKDSIGQEIARWNSIIKSYNVLADVLNTEINSTLSAQFNLANADLFKQRIEEMKNLPDQRGLEQQRNMAATIDAFQEPLPDMPEMERLIEFVKEGKPWGTQVKRQFP